MDMADENIIKGSSIPTGAYILRNKATSTVVSLFIGSDERFDIRSYSQNEDSFRDSQIWWIESLPGSEDDPHAYHTITSLARGRVLGLVNDKAPGGDGARLVGGKPSGGKWQHWDFQRRDDDPEGCYYTIVNVHSGQALDINEDGVEPAGGELCHAWTPMYTYGQHKWELVNPTVGVPTGWVRIKNASTGHLLDHTYLNTPPCLFPPPKCFSHSKDRAGWGAQWSFTRPSSNETEGRIALSHRYNRSWVIRNRLTGGILARKEYEAVPGRKLQVCAWETTLQTPHDEGPQIWELDKMLDGSWVIKNRNFVLAQQAKDSPEVTCVQKGSMMQGMEKRWIIGQLATNENALPPYEDISMST